MRLSGAIPTFRPNLRQEQWPDWAVTAGGQAARSLASVSRTLCQIERYAPRPGSGLGDDLGSVGSISSTSSVGSIRSSASRYSVLSHRSVASAASAWSALSAGSLLSFGSVGSILSIGSAGSILSIGSSGSVLSIGAAGGLCQIGNQTRARTRPERDDQVTPLRAVNG